MTCLRGRIPACAAARFGASPGADVIFDQRAIINNRAPYVSPKPAKPKKKGDPKIA